MTKIFDYYKKDLAYIHDVGFNNFAFKSAPSIIKILHKNNIKSGLIIDLGCGSGVSAQEFIKANYQVLGIDISRSMIEIAQKRVPEAEFRIESLFKTEIPPCNVVTSIGECLNYLFDEENNLQTLTNLFDRIYQALFPGGIFIFDILEPFNTEKTQGFKEEKDWIVIYEKEENKEQKTLTRRIVTLRQEGKCYRRDDEIHHVRLYETLEITEKLHQVGFIVQTMNNYGNFQLSKNHSVFIAQKI